jgi:hypothetical protein
MDFVFRIELDKFETQNVCSFRKFFSIVVFAIEVDFIVAGSFDIIQRETLDRHTNRVFYVESNDAAHGNSKPYCPLVPFIGHVRDGRFFRYGHDVGRGNAPSIEIEMNGIALENSQYPALIRFNFVGFETDINIEAAIGPDRQRQHLLGGRWDGKMFGVERNKPREQARMVGCVCQCDICAILNADTLRREAEPSSFELQGARSGIQMTGRRLLNEHARITTGAHNGRLTLRVNRMIEEDRNYTQDGEKENGRSHNDNIIAEINTAC